VQAAEWKGYYLDVIKLSDEITMTRLLLDSVTRVLPPKQKLGVFGLGPF
jgi:hypothetical protein